ncbi:hypothetical protein [[Pseudopropionibacterium] massiliense]|uniref:hypothetical protein n=1 Tax=[Pseudopropionibacterium] massiliense TaxID=2220000 RepID=UPI0013EF1D06|nr:hypothetical protein [[Pseudopropionibacterium] massiliense]
MKIKVSGTGDVTKAHPDRVKHDPDARGLGLEPALRGHQGLADFIIPAFPNPKSRQPLDAGHHHKPIPPTDQTNDFVQREL